MVLRLIFYRITALLTDGSNSSLKIPSPRIGVPKLNLNSNNFESLFPILQRELIATARVGTKPYFEKSIPGAGEFEEWTFWVTDSEQFGGSQKDYFVSGMLKDDPLGPPYPNVLVDKGTLDSNFDEVMVRVQRAIVAQLEWPADEEGPIYIDDPDRDVRVI